MHVGLLLASFFYLFARIAGIMLYGFLAIFSRRILIFCELNLSELSRLEVAMTTFSHECFRQYSFHSWSISVGCFNGVFFCSF